MEVGVPTSVRFRAAAASAYTVTAGSLPPGLSLSSEGYLEGTPTLSGRSTWTVRASSASGQETSEREFDAAVAQRPVWQTSADLSDLSDLSDLAAGTAAAVVLTATNATSYSAAGPLPEGLSLSSAGLLLGVPAAAGSYSFDVVASNDGLESTRQFTLVVQP
jgi:hypothetical protein